jgi:hypothetical protein
MEELYNNLEALLLLEGLVIFYRFRLGRKRYPDLEPKAALIQQPDYFHSYWVPPLVFLFLQIPLSLGAPEDAGFGWLRIGLAFVLTLIATSLLITFQWKRYYFTDKGIEIRALFLDSELLIPLSEIRSWDRKESSRAMECLVYYGNKKLAFTCGPVQADAFGDYCSKANPLLRPGKPLWRL